jgi:hypothetical protein
VHDTDLSGADEPPPNIMWPPRGSGFDPSGFSPAGTAIRQWRLIRRLGRTRKGRVVIWAWIVCLLVPLGYGLIRLVL